MLVVLAVFKADGWSSKFSWALTASFAYLMGKLCVHNLDRKSVKCHPKVCRDAAQANKTKA